jgi:hypothetical protein
VISHYLDSLDAELRVPRRQRERILSEARDHLHEAVAASLATGIAANEAHARAIESFGSPRELAAGFHEQLASSSAHRAAARTALFVAAVLALAAVGSGSAASDFPYGVFVFVGVQVAALAAALGLVRSLRYRAGGAIPADRLPDVYRANALAVSLAGIAALALGIGARADTDLAVAAAVLVALSALAARSVAASYSRARVVGPAGRPGDDALDDLREVLLLAFGEARERAPRAAAAAERVGVAGARLVRERAAWLDLRRRPWRFCAAFAAVCGVALAAQHAFADGGVSLHFASLGGALLASLVIATAEAAAVIASFAAFGRFLGIRR